MEDNHRKAMEKLDDMVAKGMAKETNQEATSCHVSFDAAGEAFGLVDLVDQVLMALEDEQQSKPEESLKKPVVGATIKVLQANMEAWMAKVRADDRAHFEAEWHHRMSCHQMDGTYGAPMDETEQKAKRKADEQLDKDTEGYEEPPGPGVVTPTTPPGPKPEVVVAMDTETGNSSGGGSSKAAGAPPALGPATAKAKATARNEPY